MEKDFTIEIIQICNGISNVLTKINEFDISGFSGIAQTITVDDLSFRITLQWGLNCESLLNYLTKPDIFLNYFSGTILSLGTYYFHFYSDLYSNLLLNESTQLKGILIID